MSRSCVYFGGARSFERLVAHLSGLFLVLGHLPARAEQDFCLSSIDDRQATFSRQLAWNLIGPFARSFCYRV